MKGRRSDINSSESFPHDWAFSDKSFLRHSQCSLPQDNEPNKSVSRWNPDTKHYSARERNIILNWIQTDLGVTIQPYLSNNTSTGRLRKCAEPDDNLRVNRSSHLMSRKVNDRKSFELPIDMHLAIPTYLGGLSTASSSSLNSRAQTPHEQYCDQWFNGTLLSEVIAALLIDKKHLIKEVDYYDTYGRVIVPKKLLLIGTVHVVKSTAQMLNNVDICLKIVDDHLDKLPPLTYFAQDVVYGPPDVLWNIFYILYKACSNTGKSFVPSSSHGGDGHSHLLVRGRSLSQSVDASNNTRSSSAPPASTSRHQHQQTQYKQNKQQQHQHSQVANQHLNNNLSHHVRFSKSTKGSTSESLFSKLDTPTFVNASSRGSHGQSAFNSTKVDTPPRRARSLSPSNSRSAISINSKKKNIVVHQIEENDAEVNQFEQISKLAEARRSEKMKDRLAARARDRRRRQSAIESLEGCHAPISVPDNPYANDTFPSDKKKEINGNTNTLEKGGKQHIKPGWYPPTMSPTEIERIKLQNVPTVTSVQQSRVKTWLAQQQIYLLEGEGGYYSKVFHTTAEIPPPLSLPLDRLRNGVLLCGLATLLERHAAGHISLASHTHMKPITIRMAMENLDRALWLFKMRRSPPIPIVYLSQPDEIIKCNKNIIWGLLFELMQAYPIKNDDNGVSESNAGATDIFVTSNKVDDSLDFDEIPIPILPSVRTKYNGKRRREVDVMLMAWLSTHGIIKMLYGSEFNPPVSVMALESFVKDGSLLRAIITHILEIKVQCHTRPTTYELCLSNTNKCIETFRRLGGRMNGRYLFTGVEDHILRGDWDVILGLLEDVKEYSDAIAQTPSISVFNNQQSLEMRFGQLQAARKNQMAAKANEVRLDAVGSVDYNPEKELLSNILESDSPILQQQKQQSEAGNIKKVDLNTEAISSRDIIDMDYLWGEQRTRFDLVPSRPIPNKFTETLQPLYSAADMTSYDPALDALGSVSLSGPPPPPSPVTVPEVPLNSVNAQIASAPPSIKPISPISVASPPVEITDEDSLDNTTLSTKNKKILQWMKKIGVEVTSSTDFSDGTILHSVLMKLVRCNPLPGFIAAPKTNAHKIQNIRKSLEFFASHQKRISLTALSCEDDILHNNFEAICDLLREIRRGYSIHMP